MAVLLEQHTRLIVQGLTGREGTFHAKAAAAYHTKVVGGGESTSVTFPMSALKAGESYTYECTFPGHSALMKGTLKFG